MQLNANRIFGMAGRIENVETQLTDDDGLTVIDAYADKRRGTVAMHNDRNRESFAQLMAGGKMIGMGVRIQQILQAQSFPRSDGQVTIDLIHDRIDNDRLAGLLASDEIRFTSAAADLFEEHHDSVTSVKTTPVRGCRAVTSMLVPGFA